MNAEKSPVDFGPNHLAGEGVVIGRYVFHEDYFAVHNDF